jgi:hypothetical protein
MPALFTHKTCLWNHHFSPQLEHVHSKTMVLQQWPLRTIYDILSLTNSTLLTADITLWCTKNSVPNWWFSFPFPQEKIQSPAYTVPPISHLTSCTPTKSNLYLANSLATVVRELDLYRFLTFHVPNLASLFHCLGYTKGSVLAWGNCIHFVTRPVFTVRSC